MATPLAGNAAFWVLCGVAAATALWALIGSIRALGRDPESSEEKDRVARAEIAWTIVALALLVAVIFLVVGNPLDG